MTDRKTPEQIADELDFFAEAISTRLREWAQELRKPPELPEPSRSSHFS